jgi:hypothetical protein
MSATVIVAATYLQAQQAAAELMLPVGWVWAARLHQTQSIYGPHPVGRVVWVEGWERSDEISATVMRSLDLWTAAGKATEIRHRLRPERPAVPVADFAEPIPALSPRYAPKVPGWRRVPAGIWMGGGVLLGAGLAGLVAALLGVPA